VYFSICKGVKWLIDNDAHINPIYSEINIHCLEYLFAINKTYMIKNEINLQQIERLKILASGVI